MPNARLFSLTRDPVATVGADDRYVREVIPLEGSPLTADHLRTDARLERLDAIVHLAGQVKHSRRDAAEMVRFNVQGTTNMMRLRSEERRVGKECRSRWW